VEVRYQLHGAWLADRISQSTRRQLPVLVRTTSVLPHCRRRVDDVSRCQSRDGVALDLYVHCLILHWRWGRGGRKVICIALCIQWWRHTKDHQWKNILSLSVCWLALLLKGQLRRDSAGRWFKVI